MTDADYLNALIDDGIMEVQSTYLRPDQREKREGAIKAFEDARLLSIENIAKLRGPAFAEAEQLRRADIIENYWFWRMYVLQIEWIMNAYGAMLFVTNRMEILRQNDDLYERVTGRGIEKAMDILNIVPAIERH